MAVLPPGRYLSSWRVVACMFVLPCCLQAWPAHAQAPDDGARLCSRRHVAQVPLRNDGGYLSIVAQVAGRDLSLLVDTGSDGGLLTPEMVHRLRLGLDPDQQTVVHGTGGTAHATPNAIVPDLRIGGIDFGVMSAPVGVLPGQPMITPPIGGLIGGDILSRFDLDMDVPNGQLGLWEVHADSIACAQPPAWTGWYDTLPLQRQENRFMLSVRINGQQVMALLDSGARSRIVSPRLAARLGVPAQRLETDPGGVTSGIDGHEDVYHWHRFDSLQIGHELERNPVMTVAPLREGLEMLLGSDWFAAHRVWISYATGQAFVRPAASTAAPAVKHPAAAPVVRHPQP
ncbi:retroviral-like aspartic protease family protein [Gluconacetobacter entanii]|uniref:retroviral-like aspartic protease family protein n=1 Tax=Gluconacetobacter entanii TaxID=108528 RepID=UPI0021BC02AA|nr:retroviral-like aspartic protease family protein [Gluconacetobacter entanii]MCW4579705.1 retroviral-like aspartic protease family protein [Gluconacetobacter entanii]MCW4583111.1 retroviral-like aspartic protease family protein [Gluconacetobacter entanii]MCW4586512.1 retroviral-like aspartic protease family protein [Gluconacetobacter entanii]